MRGFATALPQFKFRSLPAKEQYPALNDATMVVVQFGGKRRQIPAEAVMHLVVAWSVGGLMSFLADSYRRCAFRPPVTVTLFFPL